MQDLATLKAANQAKITDLEAKAKTLQADLDKKVTETQPIIEGFDGLMARINALNKLPFLPSFFIMLLFLAIETSPIIAKLLSSKSEYDFKQEDNEMGIKNMLAQNRYQSELQRKPMPKFTIKSMPTSKKTKNCTTTKRKAHWNC